MEGKNATRGFKMPRSEMTKSCNTGVRRSCKTERIATRLNSAISRCLVRQLDVRLVCIKTARRRRSIGNRAIRCAGFWRLSLWIYCTTSGGRSGKSSESGVARNGLDGVSRYGYYTIVFASTFIKALLSSLPGESAPAATVFSWTRISPPNMSAL